MLGYLRIDKKDGIYSDLSMIFPTWGYMLNYVYHNGKIYPSGNYAEIILGIYTIDGLYIGWSKGWLATKASAQLALELLHSFSSNAKLCNCCSFTV